MQFAIKEIPIQSKLTSPAPLFSKYHTKITREQGQLRTGWHQMAFLLSLNHYDLMYWLKLPHFFLPHGQVENLVCVSLPAFSQKPV